MRYKNGKGFVIVVIAEGAFPVDGQITAKESDEVGYENVRLGGVAHMLTQQLKNVGCEADIREMILGHLQRGGTPVSFDRVLATLYGVKALELAMAKDFGKMVIFKDHQISAVPIKEAIDSYKTVEPEGYMVKTAKSVGISFGD